MNDILLTFFTSKIGMLLTITVMTALPSWMLIKGGRRKVDNSQSSKNEAYRAIQESIGNSMIVFGYIVVGLWILGICGVLVS